MRMWQNQFDLWQNTVRKASARKPRRLAKENKSDNRFSSELWQNNPCSTTSSSPT